MISCKIQEIYLLTSGNEVMKNFKKSKVKDTHAPNKIFANRMD
jgi:hypothetical protein